MPKPSRALFAELYALFEAPVSRFDCGRHCAPHNGGAPVCCTTDHAVPIVDKHEWALLRSRTDLWRPYRPSDAAGRAIVADLHADCRAIECKGAARCERENRSLACRAFPFFPYITAEDDLIGLAPFWSFEELCWVQSHLAVVDWRFVTECLAAYEILFVHDAEERAANRDQGAAMRRVFSRWNRPIPLLGRDGALHAIEPRSHRLRPARYQEFPPVGKYRAAAQA